MPSRARFAGNTFYGDAGGNMSDHSKGGNDAFTAADFSNIFYGDAGGNMSDHSEGGNDTFTAGELFLRGNTFYGDAGGNMSDHSKGGNDTFTAVVVDQVATPSTVTRAATCPAMLKAAMTALRPAPASGHRLPLSLLWQHFLR